jgi:hypothetical protein
MGTTHVYHQPQHIVSLFHIIHLPQSNRVIKTDFSVIRLAG